MNLNFLDFERPIAELEDKIEELRRVGVDTELNLFEEIQRLEHKSKELTRHIFASLTPAQTVQMARHPLRPNFVDYVANIFTDFVELQGDRHFSKGFTIMGGPARLNGVPVMAIGIQKGRSTKEKVERNFGMPKPEDYRKALRLMEMAERFKLPIITLVDTPGAYPGIDAEARNQSEAIARNLFVMSQLKTPIISVITGEGGSGGALAIAVGDRVLMLQYSIYSVISPEGCASILWKNPEKASDAAAAMGVTADRLNQLGLNDKVVQEPLGGAHRDPVKMAETLRNTLYTELTELKKLSLPELLERRYKRLLKHHPVPA
ncbi:MAG: acetyl-CoA carboxylase carboxyltransferase subunit alpha [Gammaproteobacteria bacterium]|jgi:acetyl-CoA carboxylase carboxyl transferase subunit alpha|nr:acetyl-CoA carboxylase carboxyltransferase subunit alpha [Gammaproteobacteria bacterium]